MTSTDACCLFVDASSDAPTQDAVLRVCVRCLDQTLLALPAPPFAAARISSYYLHRHRCYHVALSIVRTHVHPKKAYQGCHTQQALESTSISYGRLPTQGYKYELSMRCSLLTCREARILEFLVDVYSCASIGTIILLYSMCVCVSLCLCVCVYVRVDIPFKALLPWTFAAFSSTLEGYA